MSVAAIEPKATLFTAQEDQDGRVSSAGHLSEWIDPEGDGWLASLYRFLIEDAALPAGGAGGPSPLARDIEHWFG
jgi:hypothetical protein